MIIPHDIVITGLGVVTAIADDRRSFTEALRRGDKGISECQDGRRRCPIYRADAPVPELEALLDRSGGGDWLDRREARKVLSGASSAVLRAVAAAGDAWRDARLPERRVRPGRIGIVVSGTNLTLDEFKRGQIAIERSPNYVRPTMAMRLADTDYVGVLSHLLPIRGAGLVAGAASASGNVALATAARLLALDELDVCLVVGSTPTLSDVETAAFLNIGAMAPGVPGAPFSAARSGFVPGTGAAAVVLERAGPSTLSDHVRLLSWFTALDGNSFADPSLDGEIAAMRHAIDRAGLDVQDVDYVSAHGSGSRLGDETEARAIATVFGTDSDAPVVNATKAFVGHCLGAAALVELVATVVQLTDGFLHSHADEPDPALPACRFAGAKAAPSDLRVALSNSFGFGGFSTAVVVAV